MTAVRKYTYKANTVTSINSNSAYIVYTYEMDDLLDHSNIPAYVYK